ncbi:hypothetical protein BpHYR1_011794 [Brachionus plicatilis]|uniref:Uncharacterized protein n=1 Tax=Brachionus plicatilis TaxID=10195 RepID=A0A3M7T8X3_BRAPC|nr:hypothetical protein BpHYR1_011794 [Brachionus plicatilis]
MVYIKQIQLCLIVLCSLVIVNAMGISSHSNSLKETEAINDLNEKLEQYFEDKNNDDQLYDENLESELRMAYLKRALPRMGKRFFWDDYDGLSSEELDYDLLKRALPRMGRALPRMGRALPRMGRALPRLGRALPRMGRTLPRMG